jgi:hypothetical protein
MNLLNLWQLLGGFKARNKPVLVWNLDEDKQENSLYNIQGVHWVDELGATVIKVKRKKQ